MVSWTIRTARSLSSAGCWCPDPCLGVCCFDAAMGYIVPKNAASIKPRAVQNWSGARDLNPGPHGPESHDSSSKHVGFCVFQCDSSRLRGRNVQICTNLQPDCYMKYYRVQV